jgi:hypothetical protein
MSTFAFDSFQCATDLPLLLKVQHYEYNLQIGQNNLITWITTSISNVLAYKINY